MLTIHREINISGGAFSTIDVTGDIPIQVIMHTEGGVNPGSLIATTGGGIGTTIMGIEGIHTSGDVTAMWEVEFEVKGVFHEPPRCEVEFWIVDQWGDTVDMIATINGEQLINTVATTDVIPNVSRPDGNSKVVFPKGEMEYKEFKSNAQVEWISTYTLDLQPGSLPADCVD
jgi:hypothetical protein